MTSNVPINTSLIVQGSIWWLNPPNNPPTGYTVEVLPHQNSISGEWSYKLISNAAFGNLTSTYPDVTSFNNLDFNRLVNLLNSANAQYLYTLNNYIY